jgi:hypothetical protein
MARSATRQHRLIGGKLYHACLLGPQGTRLTRRSEPELHQEQWRRKWLVHRRWGESPDDGGRHGGRGALQ